MNVLLRNPTRELVISGPTSVEALLGSLQIIAESVIVICNNELVTRDTVLHDADTIEIRAVTSGGSQ